MRPLRHKGETRANALRTQLDRACGRGQRTYTPSLAVVERAEGACLWTVDGRRLIDFAAGVLVANLGHNHPLFEQKFAEYARDLPRTSYNMATPVEVEASRRLLKSVGMSRRNKVLWAASGSEGIQKAMWCALHRDPERPVILATRGGFHGKKGLAGDVTGETSANPNVRWVSFPLSVPEPPAFYEAELEALAESEKGRIALLITEPYLGAHGSYHPPKWYHRLLQDWCRANGAAFIFDEVQSCHGRTGNMYAFQAYEVEPDLIVLGKGMANGEPAAAVVGRDDLIDALDYGQASDTFSGNPRACAAVCAAFDVFKQQRVLQRARKTGRLLRARLEQLKDRLPFVREIRGEGMVFGIEMTDTETAERCVLAAYQGDGACGVHFLGPLAGKVLRVSPPLVISEGELEEAFAIIERSWARAHGVLRRSHPKSKKASGSPISRPGGGPVPPGSGSGSGSPRKKT